MLQGSGLTLLSLKCLGTQAQNLKNAQTAKLKRRKGQEKEKEKCAVKVVTELPIPLFFVRQAMKLPVKDSAEVSAKKKKSGFLNAKRYKLFRV